jgi:hypothetical protein
VVNLSDAPSQAQVQVRWPDAGGATWTLNDMSGATYERDGDEMLSPGFYVELGPWNYHFFECVRTNKTRPAGCVGSERLLTKKKSCLRKRGIPRHPTKKSAMIQVETNEQRRLSDAREKGIPWKKRGPYLSERQWGRFAKIPAKTGMPGTISPMIRRAHGPIVGRRWTGRTLRQSPDPLFRTRTLEPPRPNI